MNVKKANNLLSVLVTALVSIAICGAAHAQQRLTYPQVLTALNAKLPRGFTKAKLIEKLIADVQMQKMDKPLTADREDDLRQAGATTELIAGIRANSPALPKPVPTQTPTTEPVKKYDLPPISELLKNAPKPGDVRKNIIGMELVWIPPGSFMMGSESGEADEKPVHRVTISQGFWMGKYEVTQSQYESVMGTNPSNFKGCAECPVEQVSWDDAKAFVSKLNAKNDGLTYRLPSEAEWEYAARAGTTTAFAFGDSLSADQANFDGNYPYGGAAKGKYLEKTTPAGSYRSNAFGLYDMHGNVWEWCEDWYGTYLSGAMTGPTGAESGQYRVLRGGSWFSVAFNSRSADRIWFSPSTRSYGFGFRVTARAR
jgi:formylglycine-generating enzyme required for sulfatase activity